MFSSDDKERLSLDSTNGVTVGRTDQGHVSITDSGISIFGTSGGQAAYFGTTAASGDNVYARIGHSTNSRFVITPIALRAYTGTAAKPFFEVTASGLKYGTDLGNTVETTTGAQNKADAAKSSAEKTATNYMYFDETNGLKIAQSSPSGAARIIQITPSSGIFIKNDANNYAKVDGSGLTIFQGGSNVATFGSSMRIGIDQKSRFLVNSSSLQAFDSSNSKYFEVSAGTTTIGQTNNAHFIMAADKLQAFSSTNTSQPYFEVSASGLKYGTNLGNTVATTTDINNMKISSNLLQNSDDLSI